MLSQDQFLSVPKCIENPNDNFYAFTQEESDEIHRNLLNNYQNYFPDQVMTYYNIQEL